MAKKVARRLLIQGGRVIDPGQGIDGVGNLIIADGRVSWLAVGEDAPPEFDGDVLDATGWIVCPGFIDLHCHLREPGFEAKETIATGTLAAARGGFTTVCCMPNTDPPLDSETTVEFVKRVAATDGVVRVLPIGCISDGRRGLEIANLEEMADAGVIAFSDDGDPVMSASLMREALDWSRTLGLPIIEHCEDRSLSGSGHMNEGKLAVKLRLNGIPAEAEEHSIERNLALARLTEGRLHIAHVSTRGSVELIRRAKDKGVRVTAEVTPHHLTLTEEEVTGRNTNAKVNPPLRTKKDIKALIQGLKENVIDIIATDHAPHTEEDKSGDFALAPFGISGLETALGSLMRLVHAGDLPLPLLVAKLTSAPAKIIGEKFGQLGTLAEGVPADIAVFDPEREWVVNPATFASKGKNTPLAGLTLKGRVMATIYGGKMVYKDDSVSLVKRVKQHD
ncbi:MAG: dihydroorotase [Chloroflexi bacterium]|nr:dihydroorotase [Chloroflexota bacterium]